MKRREFLKATALTTTALATGTSVSAREKKNRRPNIIYIMADDLGYGDLSCYGQTLFKTPNIDRLAKEGMRFTQHYAGSTVCAPSRCCLMTGLHTGHAFIRGNKEVKPEGQYPIPKDTFTVAKLMKKAGYKTGIVGKWGLGSPDSDGRPNRQGFDYWFGLNCQRQAHKYYPTHMWENETKIDLGGKVYSHDLLTEKVLQFIDDNQNDPFFLYVPYTIPHAELNVPEDSMQPYRGKFKEISFGGRGNYGATDEPRAAFAGMVSRLDRDVGRIMDRLKARGIDDNTLVLFTSDNGPHREGGHDPDFFDSNGPLRGIKRDLYEGGIRVPLIARWPNRIKPDSLSDHVSAFWDFLPTCADLAGMETPQDIDGISYAPILIGQPEKQEKHDFLYWEFHERGFNQAVRMGDWKAVCNRKNKSLELYNLKIDLGEKNNVADQHPDIVKKVEAYLQTARTESRVFPVK